MVKPGKTGVNNIGWGGPINPQSLCGNCNKDNNNNNAQCEECIEQDGLSLISYSCKCLVYSLREGGDTIVACFKSVVAPVWKRRPIGFSRYLWWYKEPTWGGLINIKRGKLYGRMSFPQWWTVPFVAVHNALKYGWVSTPYHLMLYTSGVAEYLYPI